MKTRRFNVYLFIQILLIINTLFFLVVYALGLENITLFKESFTNFMNGVYCLALSLLPWIIKKLRISFTNTLAVYFLLAIITHFIIGGTFWGYKTKYFSFAVHLVNSFLMGVVCYGIILRNVKKQSKLFMFLLTLACVVLIGGVWELVEYTYDTFFNGNMQKFLNSKTLEPFIGQRALYDTMHDILMDFLGGVFAGIFSNVFVMKKPLYLYFELKSKKYRKSMLGYISYYEEKSKKEDENIKQEKVAENLKLDSEKELKEINNMDEK